MLSRRTSLLCALAAAALLMPVSLLAQTGGPQIVTISGDPLKINVAADGSFQVFNNAVPGNGQIFPTGCQYGDMGVFARVGSTLFAPDFRSHTCGTATGNLGTYTTWTPVAISQVQGTGEGRSPFAVTVSLSGGGLNVSITVSYVNGDNFFRLRKSFTGSGAQAVTVFLGADIYLASSDSGIFFFEPNLHAPGGVDCQVPSTYHILLIPTQPDQANHVTTAFYGSVWSQIGQGSLNDNITPTTCTDNGAGLEWDNVLSGGVTSAVLQSAVSFGAIPTITGVAPFIVSVDPTFVSLFPGESAVFTVTTAHNPDTEFNAAIELSVPNAPQGITATFDHTTIPAPGDGTAKMTLQLAPDIFPATYRGISVVGTGGDDAHSTEGASVGVEVICDPPIILAINNPQSQSVKRGSTATLTVKAEGPGPFTYTWYNGHAGFTSTPIANSNSATLTTPPINTTQEFWVRVSNACGTQNSGTATITPHD